MPTSQDLNRDAVALQKLPRRFFVTSPADSMSELEEGVRETLLV